MIAIRNLTLSDVRQLIKLKADCWVEELAGMSNEKLDLKEQYEFWSDWMQTADKHNDVRHMYGAFINNELAGAAIGSFVENKDNPEIFELNGLWVFPHFRNLGISLSLFAKIVDDFADLGARKCLLYNFHHAPSNQYYRKLGFKVIDTDIQLKEKVPVDIFLIDIPKLKVALEEKLSRQKANRR